MPPHAFEALLIFILIILYLALLVRQGRLGHRQSVAPASACGPRALRPHTPDKCGECRQGGTSPGAVSQSVIPYAQLKSSRGRKKRINTAGFACPFQGCRYFNNSDPAVHALVGYGHHGRHEPIQDLYCQGCKRKFSARRHTPLYRLKTPGGRVAQVLQAVAEGLSSQAAARVFQLSEATVRSWLARAGQHSGHLHDRLLCSLRLKHVQLDELHVKLRGAAEAAWLWIAYDAQTKLIPVFKLGPRTQALAHQLVHELASRLASGCLPVFSSDGLSWYFYALTAHFGQWVQEVGRRKRRWIVAADLLYAQLIKRYRRRRLVEVHRHVYLGSAEAYSQVLKAVGLSGRIQTAFVERLNLTIRRSIAGLARRSWSLAHSLGELTLHFAWWRAYYHFARPHAALRQPIGRPTYSRQRYRQRTPAQAAGLTRHCWTVRELLTTPAPPLAMA